MKIGTTARGFDLIEFTDRYGNECSVQKSSLATEDAIWLGVNEAKPRILASQAAEHGVRADETTGWVDYPIPEAVSLSTRMHLTREQVAELVPILQRFGDTGEIVQPDSLFNALASAPDHIQDRLKRALGTEAE